MFIHCLFENYASIFIKGKDKSLGTKIIENYISDVLGTKLNLKKPAMTKYFDARNSETVSGSSGLLIASAYGNDGLWSDIDEILLTTLPVLQPTAMYGGDLKHMFLDDKICMDPVLW